MNPTQTTAFTHAALIYGDEAELLENVLPFLREGAERGEALLVAVPRARAELIRGALEESVVACFMAVEEEARNPGRLISSWTDLLHRRGGEANGVRAVAETIWPQRSAAALEECERHDMLVDRAFAGLGSASLLCPFDRAALDPAIVERAGRFHSALIEDSHGASASPCFIPPGRRDPFAGQLPAAAGAVERRHFEDPALHSEREFLRGAAEAAGLAPERVDDFVLAGNELASNSLQHGGGAGDFAVWVEDGELRCEVRDRGRIEEPLVGRLRPPIDQPRGRGLWLANQLCDLVQIRSGAAGTAVRLTMSLG